MKSLKSLIAILSLAIICKGMENPNKGKSQLFIKQKDEKAALSLDEKLKLFEIFISKNNSPNYSSSYSHKCKKKIAATPTAGIGIVSPSAIITPTPPHSPIAVRITRSKTESNFNRSKPRIKSEYLSADNFETLKKSNTLRRRQLLLSQGFSENETNTLLGLTETALIRFPTSETPPKQ
jgi:hypothetical protein